jgi:hypothetical protein
VSADACSCSEPDWQKRPPHDQRDLPGCDEQGGRFATASLDTCRACGRIWLTYGFEIEAFSKSGRWYRGLIAPDAARTVTAASAAALLESLDWYWAGGSYFDGQVLRRAGAIV